MPISPARDLELLRRTIELAQQSRERGDHPFGALLADADGKILLESMNTGGTLKDATGHAERNLMTLASMTYGADFLRSAACTQVLSRARCAPDRSIGQALAGWSTA